MKRRIVTKLSILIICSLLVLVVGCQAESTEEVAEEIEEVAEESEEEVAEEIEEPVSEVETEKYTFGLSLYANDDPLASEIIRLYEFAANSLGSEAVFAVDSFDPDQQIANIENFISMGVDSITIPPCSDAVVGKLVKICDDAKVPLTLSFRSIVDPEIREYAYSSEYFLGYCHEDEFEVGYNLGKILADKGCKNVAVINYQHGDTTAEARYNGYMDAFEEFGVNVVAEQWEILTADKAAAATESFIASFPELDGIAVVGGGGGPLEGTVTTIKNQNKLGEILVTGCDFGPSLKENLENQEVAGMSGGHHTDSFYAFILSYNYVNGTPLSDEPEDIVMKPLFIDSVEAVENYEKWIVGDLFPYTEEEIINMTKTHNPEFTLEDLREIAWNYTIDDVMERHEGMLE
jgi:ribose transport system substrate-binding protein